MTYTSKITSSLKSLLREGYSERIDLFHKLLKYTSIDNNSFDAQYYFHSFYLSFTYYKEGGNNMCLYTDRYSSDCPLICFERNGDIIIGNAINYINIYNGCSPTIQDLENINIDLESYEYLVAIRTMISPMLQEIAKRHLYK